MIRRVSQVSVFIVLIAAVLVLIAGFRPIGLDRDSLNYAAVVGSGMGGAFFGSREPTFWIISLLSQSSPLPVLTTFFLLYALIGVYFKTAAILQLSYRPLLSMYLYVMLYFVAHEFTQIRTGVAAGIYLFALHSLSQGARGEFLFRLFAAVCFHYSAVIGLVMLLIPRVCESRLRLFALPLVGIAIGQILTVDNVEALGSYVLPGPIQGRLFLYLELLSDDRFNQINVLNPVTTSYLLFYWVMALKMPASARPYDRYLLMSFGVGLSSFYAFSLVPVVAFRVMELLGVGVVILLASATHWFRDKQIWIFVVMLWALAVFVVQSLILSLGGPVIAGILVSYEPEAQTLDGTFASLLPQVEHLFLVDNGSSIDPADLLDLKGEERLTIIRLDENIGIAAAQNVGIAAAREVGADFVVLSDQDTVYPQGAISRLIDVFERWPNAAAVVPLFNDVNKSSSDGFILENSCLFSPTPVSGGEHSLLQAIASGKVIRLSTLEDIGTMDEELFIDWVDLEWCWRARHRGYQVIGSGDVEVSHSLGDTSRNIGFREVNLRSPLRHYYITRNAFSLALSTPYLSIVMRCILFVRSLRYPFAFPILSRPRSRNLRAVMAGISDAILGRLGKTNRTL